MVVVSKIYNPTVYDSLVDVHVVNNSVTKEDRRGLGVIIIKYGYADQIGVQFAHKHHNIQMNEAMLEKKENNHLIQTPMPIAELVAMDAQPIALKYYNDTWYPVTFSCEKFTKCDPWLDEAFLKEIGGYLAANNLSDYLMLYKRMDVKGWKAGKVYMEQNCNDTRTSIWTLQDGSDSHAIPANFFYDTETGDEHILTECQQD